MTPELSYHFFNKLGSDYFSLVYMGAFNDELTNTLLRVNETGVQEQNVFKKKLSFLIAECFHNIILHADKPAVMNRTNNKPKMFLVRNTERGFYISTANLIDNQKKVGLVSKLNSINSLSKEELKTFYLNALGGSEFPGESDGGLGLMEMARQSNCKLEYDFDQVNYFFSSFFLQLEINTVAATKENKQEEKFSEEITLKSAKELYNTMVNENILMIRKGDFSQQSILPLLELIGSNLNSEDRLPSSKKKTISLLIELLQNISKHAAEVNGLREGIFIIAVKDGKFTLNTGNFIETKNVESLKGKLKTVSGLDKKELTAIYKDYLLNKDVGHKGSAGVGLIEVSKYSSEKIKYNFKPVSEQLSFFSINITV